MAASIASVVVRSITLILFLTCLGCWGDLPEREGIAF
jgi:hypothetical protein